jgi:hypothetical protein
MKNWYVLRKNVKLFTLFFLENLYSKNQWRYRIAQMIFDQQSAAKKNLFIHSTISLMSKHWDHLTLSHCNE